MGSNTQEERLKKANRFERALDKVEKLFKSKAFKGSFRMSTFGNHSGNDHDAPEKNYCGTSACLAGWLAIVDKRGFKPYWDAGVLRTSADDFENISVRLYGGSVRNFDALFYMGINLQGEAGLKLKLRHARLLAKALRSGKDKDFQKFKNFGI